MATAPLPVSSRLADGRRGSVLIVTLILALAIAVALGSYLRLAQHTLRTSNRAHYHNVAMNLAETGLERGMLAVSRAVEIGDDAWLGWSFSEDGRDAFRIFDGFTFDAKATGLVRVRVEDYQGAETAVVLARATLELPGAPPLERWLRVTCDKTSPFGNGLSARHVMISGGARCNSYSSSKGEYGATLADGASNVNDRIFIGAATLESDLLHPGKLIIEGMVAVAGEEGFKLTGDATIGPLGVDGINSEALRFDFAMSYDDVAAPTESGTTLASITTPLTLPREGDPAVMRAGRKTFHYQVTNGILLTTDGATLTISEGEDGETSDAGVDVVLTVLANIKIDGGDAGIRVEGKNGLALYTAGDILLGGGGVENEGVPAQFQVWGTRAQSDPIPQKIDLRGHNGELAAVVYAPNASITMDGGSGSDIRSVYGAAVGRQIKIAGGSNFHYDEMLREAHGRFAYRVSRWEELSAAEQRSAVASALNF